MTSHEHPILFTAPMVEAILEGRKTQTRRPVKPQPLDLAWFEHQEEWCAKMSDQRYELLECPFGEEDDSLWVRETHAIVPATAYRHSREEDGSMIPHRVSPDGQDWAVYRAGWDRCEPSPWKPSIHMPRWASRLTLRITDICVEQVQSITEADAVAEGCQSDVWSARRVYQELWDEIYAENFPWESNPWVWVIEFEVIQ